VKALRVLGGACLGLLVIALLWAAGALRPPEGITRRLAAYSAVFPGPVARARVERIPCPPLERLRLYVVCTDDCEGVWRIVGVRGLGPRNLVDLGRVPPEPTETTRERINAEIAAEGLRLDLAGAREMIGCYLRLDGLHPELVLEPADREAVEGARGDEEAMRRVAEGLDEPGAVGRIPVEEVADGFTASLLYWHTARDDRPVLEIEYRLRRDGRVESVRARPLTPVDGTASGSTPGTPPI
jgi:hypothetical protein